MKNLNRTQNDSELVDVQRDVVNKWRCEWLETSINVDPAELHPKLKCAGGRLHASGRCCWDWIVPNMYIHHLIQ